MNVGACVSNTGPILRTCGGAQGFEESKGDVLDVGVGVRSEKINKDMAMRDEDDFLETRIDFGSQALGLEPHTCMRKVRVYVLLSAVRCARLYICAYTLRRLQRIS